MTRKRSTGDSKKLLGFLECPLRHGFLEFEYELGDQVSELKEKVVEEWGSPIAVGRKSNRADFKDAGHWVILCQDESGAYVPLSDTDQIPSKPFPTKPSRNLTVTARQLQYFLKDLDVEGIIHVGDCWYTDQEHLTLELPDQYDFPEERYYSVKLIALVAITGG